jgi:uncharacterized protein
MSEKLAVLRAQLRAHAPLVIAYSGGVDSAYLLAEAQRTLGDGALGVIADSASLPRQALADALALAASIGARVEVVRTDELANSDYAANPVNRCYFCKAELFTKLDALAVERGYRAIAYGENADDVHQARPGRLAAEKFSVLAPLKDAGFTKAEIREESRALGLPTADALARVERAEAAVRALGFRVFRVRHIVGAGELPRARVQIAPGEMSRLSLVALALKDDVRAAGYAGVEIDPAGYRAPA